jgi:hypothetical protein
MAAPVIQLKRGLLANLPGLRAGEPGFATDSYDLYVGLTSETSTNKFLGSHRYWTKETATAGGSVNILEGTNNGTHSISLKAPASLAASLTYTLPATDGNSGQVIATNASGVLSFIDAAASLTIAADSGSNDTVALLTDTLTFAGTANEVETTASNNQIQIGLPNDVTITGELNANGDVNLGNATSDTITATGRFDSDLVPSTDSARDLGTSALQWKDLYIDGTANIDSLTLGSGATVVSILDEDAMGTNSNTSLATQQSIKAYVDSQVTAQDLDFQGDSGGALSIDLDSEALTIAGTANEIETAGASNTVTIGLPSAVVVTTSIDVPTVEVTNVKAKDGTAAITITDSTGAVAFSQNLTVAGNLIVNGSTTQVNTAVTTIEDQLLDLGMVDGSVPSSDLDKDIGVLFNYYSGSAKKAAVFWDDSTSRIVAASVVSESGGVLTTTTCADFEIGSLYVTGCNGTTDKVIDCASGENVLTNITLDGGAF